MRRVWKDDEVTMSVCHTTATELAEKVKELKRAGWKDVDVDPGHADNGRGRFDHSRPHRITGKRLETTQEENKRRRAKERCKANRERFKARQKKLEITMMRRLARKHGYSLEKLDYEPGQQKIRCD